MAGKGRNRDASWFLFYRGKKIVFFTVKTNDLHNRWFYLFTFIKEKWDEVDKKNIFKYLWSFCVEIHKYMKISFQGGL